MLKFNEIEVKLIFQILWDFSVVCLNSPETVARLDKAFQNFFRRCKSGEKPGFPRFRGSDRYNSFCYSQSGFSLDEKELKLSKIGNIRIIQHRPIQGKIKTCTIRREAEKWYASFSCEIEAEALPNIEKSIGIDLGIESFATLSDGQQIENPRFFKSAERELAKVQRKLSKCEMDLPNEENKKRLFPRYTNGSKIKDPTSVIKFLEDL